MLFRLVHWHGSVHCGAPRAATPSHTRSHTHAPIQRTLLYLAEPSTPIAYLPLSYNNHLFVNSIIFYHAIGTLVALELLKTVYTKPVKRPALPKKPPKKKAEPKIDNPYNLPDYSNVADLSNSGL